MNDSAAHLLQTARSPPARHHPRTGSRDQASRSRTPTRAGSDRPPGKRYGLPARPPPGTSHGPDGHGGGTPARRCASSPKYGADRGLSVAVRGKPTVRTDRPDGTDAVRYTSVDTATHRLTVTHRDTPRDKKKTAPAAPFRSQGAVFAGSGRCWVRTNVG